MTANSTVSVPAGLASTISQREGASGRAWLASLPTLLSELLATWAAVPDGSPMHGGTSLVLPVRLDRGDGQPAVVKVIYPAAQAEIQAVTLAAVTDEAGPHVYAHDERGGLLLERLDSTTLASVADPWEAIAIAGRLCRSWAAAQPVGIRRLADNPNAWADAFQQQNHRHGDYLPAGLVARAVATIIDLRDDPSTSLIHGDLYAPNILRNSRGQWVAIDPDPWIGPPAFDTCTVICDRLDLVERATDPAVEVRTRIRLFADAASLDAAQCARLAQARIASGALMELEKRDTWRAALFARIASILAVEDG